jgi:molybdate transport system regulatory protein
MNYDRIYIMEERTMEFSARNNLKGKVVKLVEGQVNCEVVIELDGGEEIVSIISLDSAKRLKLGNGKRVSALIKASNVIIGV